MWQRPVPPCTDLQIVQLPVFERIHPSVNVHVSELPLACEHVRREDVRDLDAHVRFRERSEVASRRLWTHRPRELGERGEPALERAGTGEGWGVRRGGLGACFDTTAACVPDHDDVLDLKSFDGVCEH